MLAFDYRMESDSSEDKLAKLNEGKKIGLVYINQAVATCLFVKQFNGQIRLYFRKRLIFLGT